MNKTTFEQLAREILPGLYRLAVSILRSPVDSEDAVMHALENAWAARDRIRSGSEKSYIAKIVINECRNIQRMRQRMCPTEEIAEGAFTPENGDLKRAIDVLDSSLRIPFLLKYMEGYSEKEVANTLGITVANVKSRLLRARSKLRKELTEEDELE